MRKITINRLRAIGHLGKRRKAVTILEFLIWTGLVAVVLGGVGLYSLTARNSSKVNSTVTEIGQVRSTIDRMYPAGDYTALTTGQVATALPTSLVQGTAPSQTILDPFGGAITATGSAGNYIVTATQLPKAACQAIAALDFGAAESGLSINGTAQTLPVAPASSACNSAYTNTVAITFH